MSISHRVPRRPRPTTRPQPGRRRTAALACTALTVGALGAVPAQASLTGNGVRPGSSVTVLHNIDLVHVAGYGNGGEEIVVEVLRNGVTIGSASGPAQLVEGSMGLEINHGPEGTPAPGDCWTGHTPDVRPGDVIQVTDAGGTDEVTVDDITFTEDPVLDANDDVLVHGIAKAHDGTPIPPSRLNAAEFRSGPRFRMLGEEIRVEPTAGIAGGFTMRYVHPYRAARNRDGLDVDQRQALLLGDGHAIGFVDEAEAMVVEGLGDSPGPAPGCEGSPAARYAVAGLRPGVINVANRGTDLTVSGLSQDTSAIEVTLSDVTGARATAMTTPTPATGAQTWSVTVPAAALAALDGLITVAGSYVDTASGQELTGATKTLLKDTVAPTAPTVSLPGGAYRGPQQVSLDAGPGDKIRWTLGNGTQAAPTPTSGSAYTGGQITISSSQTLKVIAIDTAENPSPRAVHKYVIGNVPSRPGIRRALPGKAGGAATAVARWRAPEFTNGSRITGYRVTALRLRPNGTVASRKTSGMLPRRARTLQMKLAPARYQFQARAYNAIGAGRMSARSNAVRAR